MTRQDKVVKIYTDGAVQNQHRPSARKAGIGAVLLAYRDGKLSKMKTISHYLGNVTNNVAELMAVKLALEALDLNKLKGWQIQIHSDSAYVVNTFTEWIKFYRSHNWRTKTGKPVGNEKLIREIYNMILRIKNVEFVKVVAHSGIKWNERADYLARQAILDYVAKNEGPLLLDPYPA